MDTTSPAYKWSQDQQEIRQKAMEQFLVLLNASKDIELIKAFRQVLQVGALR